MAAAVSSCSLRASSVSHREPEKNCIQQTTERSAALCNSSAWRGSTHIAAGQTVAQGLRRPSSSSFSSAQTHPHTLDTSQPALTHHQSPANTAGLDDFDDWDVDLADLDECDQQMVQSAAPAQAAPAFNPATSAKTLRPPTSSGPNRTQRDLNAAPQAPGSSSSYLPTRICSTHVLRTANPRPSPLSAPPQSPSVFSGLTVSSPAPSPISRTLNRPQRPWATPGPSPQGRAIFESFSPAPCSSLNSSTLSPHPLHTPVLTNRLVQLVSASNKLPQRRPRSESHRPRTRRFPGPAGFLPEQVSVILQQACQDSYVIDTSQDIKTGQYYHQCYMIVLKLQ